MSDPLISLILGFIIVSALMAFFFPDKGLLAIWRRSAKDSKKEALEDALKHVYDCEYNSLSCTIRSIAGHLHTNMDKAAEVSARLESMGLITSNNQKLYLTDEGRSYALRIIRVHRLWEHYLADHSSVKETEWHSEAEIVEHTMTIEEADSLAAKMGNPLIDPHGDPIPTAGLELPELGGVHLNELEKGDIGRIIHLEDEPQAVFSQLIAMGLHNGMQIHIIDKRTDRIIFEANGEENILAPTLAANITVKKIEDQSEILDDFTPLSSLQVGETGIVKGISRALRGQQRRRLMDLGVVPGSKITPELVSRAGNPVAYRIRGASVALRKQHSDLIFVEKGE
ncbi:MAG: hypothetical protein SCALA702_24840 [Melioribacteraceae bacterium]|nr:MAG: hypothetical protein SCALA702_24840 [Melioribacteraceae bacterium]